MNVQRTIFNSLRVMNPGQKITPSGLKELNGVRSGIYANKKTFHVTSQVKYPLAKNIPLPNNIEAIMSIEIGQFSPQRTRDITGPVLISQERSEVPHRQFFSASYDPYVESFDCTGAVNLNSSMQSNVPMPYRSRGYVSNLNMPGGQWEQGNKFISEDMQKSHYDNLRKNKGIRMFHSLTNHLQINTKSSVRSESTKPTQTISKKDKLKRLVAEYGTTVVVFHIGISLASLGAFYMLVKSGLDVEKILVYLPWSEGTTSKIAQNAGTFALAYAIHKVFAPVRISITLTSAPFIVRYLRNKGILKVPKT